VSFAIIRLLQEIQSQKIINVLLPAKGFIGTAEQTRYDESENALSHVVQEVRNLGRQWKVRHCYFAMLFNFTFSQDVLIKRKYYIALGFVVDAVLSTILDEILALPDIPEAESHQLSELCRILNALEGLFVEDAELVHCVPFTIELSNFHIPLNSRVLWLCMFRLG
jgi:centromere/kinetochore protein ZW10